jgi:hypothetical protein
MTEENQQYPSLGEQVKNFGSSFHELVSSAVQGNRLLAPKDTQLARLETCKSCEFFDTSQERCTKCGCYLRVKTAFSYETCPVGKWGTDDSLFKEWLEEDAEPTFNGETSYYTKRLPNGKIVSIEEYEQRLEEFGDNLTEE